MDEIVLSPYGQRCTTPAPINRLMTEFASGFREGLDVNVGCGYVNEQTMPREQILAALNEVLHEPAHFRQPLNYGGPQGSPNLLKAVRRFLVTRRDTGLTEELLARREVVIGPNGATSLLEAIAQILPRGLVITSDPMYYVYTDTLERLGFDLLTVPEDDQGLRVDLLNSRLERLGSHLADIRFFYVGTINNPSCTILSNQRRRELIDAVWQLSCRLGRKVPLILDCAYEDLIHGGQNIRLESGLPYDPGGIVFEIGTLSKVLAPALRIGYLVGPPGDFLKALIQRTADVGFSAPLVNQEISAVLLDREIAAQLSRVRAGYGAKAQALRTWLEESLQPEMSCMSGGRAGFYFYITFRTIETHSQSPFFRFLTRSTGRPDIDGPPENLGPRVIYVPGTCCVHPRGDLAGLARRQLRLSYGFEDLPNLQRAVALMRQAADYARAESPRSP